MKPRLLLVSHEATRTGAPKVGRHLLDELGSEWETVLVQRWRGPMSAELDAAAHRSVPEPWSTLRVVLRRFRPTKWLAVAVERRAIRRVLRREQPALVWCNTVMTSRYVTAAVELGIPVVLHSHEQRDLVAGVVRRAGVTATAVARSAHLTPIGCATDTAAALAAELGLAVEDVGVLHSPIDVDAVRSTAASAERPALPPPPVVVACGVGDERKGVDVFAAAAERSSTRGDGVAWVWVGRPPEERSDAVTYAGEHPSALPWLAAADLVALPSRGDPFPLVVLEAMAVGTAVVASDIPGPHEQLGDAGTFVPVGDAGALADAVVALLADPDRRAALATRGAERCGDRWGLGPFGEHARRIAREAVAG